MWRIVTVWSSVDHMGTNSTIHHTTATLRLAGRLLTILSTTDTTEAADLARTVSANPSGVSLDTLERVSGLFGVHPTEFLKEPTA